MKRYLTDDDPMASELRPLGAELREHESGRWWCPVVDCSGLLWADEGRVRCEKGHEGATIVDALVGRLASLHRDTDDTKQGRYELIHAGALEPATDSQYLIKGLLERNSLCVIYGQSGSTKSFVATEILASISTGRQWRESHKTHRGAVIYVAAEGARGMRNRLVALRKAWGGDLGAFYLLPDTVRLTDDLADVADFVDAVTGSVAHDVEAVCIDTLSQSMPGGDENGPSDMTAAIAAAQAIQKRLECTVIIVHHAGKDQSRGARGHSSLRAATDTELEVSIGPDGLCTLKATKQKESEVGSEWGHRLRVIELGEDLDGDPVTSAVILPVDLMGEQLDSIERLKKKLGKDNIHGKHLIDTLAKALADGYGSPLPEEEFRSAENEHSAPRPGQLALKKGPIGTAEVSRLETALDSNRDTCRRIWNRALKTLYEREIIGLYGDWIWLKED